MAPVLLTSLLSLFSLSLSLSLKSTKTASSSDLESLVLELAATPHEYPPQFHHINPYSMTMN